MLVLAPHVDRTVGFNLRIRDRPLRAGLAVFLRHRAMVDRRDPRVLPLRSGSVDHQIHGVVLEHRLQQMEPTERKQMR